MTEFLVRHFVKDYENVKRCLCGLLTECWQV